jgi:hypothetical protein
VPPVGFFSAPDARTLRLLYAVDPFFDLDAGTAGAEYGVDAHTTKVVRRR